ncbi:metallophosphoesterase [Lujinxingia litoralis]|uniref:Metallophosphoesterase n=1 Tax=Lujinxingia litoralis TaxID=2211119 RepID=A0A328C687_9DELT|nr:metallophosphoesterase family protein [Lujinxingia litoralis]RAL20024.1 metallophosphoesterase [Lujinxingia litoralis]
MSHLRRFAIFGGVYNNFLSLEATLAEARALGCEAIYCLGDMGGVGPCPDRVFPLLRESADLFVMQGNYDHSIGHRLEDCACGYTDPRDNYYAQISYDYTLAHTADEHKDWLRDLPTEFRRQWGGARVLMSHGSPRQVNEFLWESMCPDSFLTHLLDEHQADVLFITHTGIPWQRRLPDGRQVINVGAIGRPANNGRTSVDYALVEVEGDEVRVTLRPIDYDHQALAELMRQEGLPEPFVETILTGWWTTCLEVMPARERARGRY